MNVAIEEDRISMGNHGSPMPPWARWIADFIQRIGFPIFMCLVMTYILCFVLDRNTKAVVDLTVTMQAIQATLASH
jgi:hypothetical protein